MVMMRPVDKPGSDSSLHGIDELKSATDSVNLMAVNIFLLQVFVF